MQSHSRIRFSPRTERKYLDRVQHNTRQTYPKDPKVVIFVLSSHQQLVFQIINMDPRYTGEILKHLEKQNELLTEAKISMSEELHQLKVEEEMLMRKFYEIMSAHGKVKKNEDRGKVSDDGEIGGSTALAIAKTSKDEECR
ncbi:hypothetical protein C1H46_021503 [Malus baccata]|uniref:Uncharacterized protein n=1 Tax=Malus baccata TaxID=106549 RepID=A0A540M299_MALBA|nr:hypothetical protein C1H46_021503 [Malus baccata]